MKKKNNPFKQCCCFEVEGDNVNCPVHYPKFVQFQLILAIIIMAVFFIGGIYLAAAGCQ